MEPADSSLGDDNGSADSGAVTSVMTPPRTRAGAGTLAREVQVGGVVTGASAVRPTAAIPVAEPPAAPLVMPEEEPLEVIRSESSKESAAQGDSKTDDSAGSKAVIGGDGAGGKGGKASGSKLRPPVSLLRFNRTAFLMTGGALALVALFVVGALLLTHFVFGKNTKTPLEANNYATGKLSLGDLIGEDQLQVGNASQLAINGLLRVNDTLVLSPSAVPNNPTTGQIYFDQAAKAPFYYNGTQFISLAPGPHVGSIGGVSGDIGLGQGLTMTGNQLSVSSTLLQQVANAAAASDSGPRVTSLQGQTGAVTLNGGPGISINGTTISNSGVISLVSGSGNLTVTNDGAGNYTVSEAAAGGVTSLNGLAGALNVVGTANQVTVNSGGSTITLSLPQSIAVTSAPTFGGLTVSGTLAVQGVNSLTLGTAGGNTGSAKFYGSNGNSVTLQAGAVGSNLTFTLPTADGSNGACLMTNGSGALSFQPCTGGPGGGVTSVDGLAGILTINNSSGSGTAITIDDAAADGATKGIATFDAGNFTDDGAGVINTIQGIAVTSSPTFAGLTVNGTVTATTLNATGAIQLGGVNINTAGTLSNVAYLNGTGPQTFSGNNKFTGTVLTQLTSPAAFEVQDGLGTSNLFVANTSSNRIGIGTLGPGYKLDVQGGDINTSGIYRVNGAQISSADLSNDANLAKLNAANIFSAANTFSSTVAIQGSNSLTLGSGSNVGSIIFRDGSTVNTGTLQLGGSLSGNVTFSLPVTTGAQTICTVQSGNCAGSGSGITGSGTTNKLAKFTGSQAIGDSSISDDGSVVTVATGAIIQGAAGLTLGNAGVNGQLSFISGSTGNTLTLQSGANSGNFTLTLPSADGSNGNCLKTDGSGNLSFASCTGGAGGGVTSINTLTGVLNIVGTANQIAVGTAGSTITLSLPQDINTGGNANFRTITLTGQAAGDNLIVANAVSGATGDLIDLQVNGISQFTVTPGGNVNTIGQYQVNGVQISSANLSNDANLAKLNGTGPQTFTGNNKFTGTVLAQNAADSTAAFQIQNQAGTSNLFTADTQNTRIGIGTATPGYTLDVNGDVNTSGVYRINGVTVCSASGCTPSSGSGDYIQNGTSPQTADFNITGDGTVGGLLTANQLAVGPAAVPTGGVLTVGTNTTAASGGIYFGTDTNLYRDANSELATDSAFNVNGPYIFISGPNAEVGIYRDGYIQPVTTNPTDLTFNTAVYGEGFGRLSVTAAGAFSWGGGAAPADVNLYRSAAGTLKTDGSFTAAGTLQGNIVNGVTALQLNGVNINTAGTLSNVAYLNQNQTFTGTNAINNTSTAAFQVQGAGGTGNNFIVDTQNNFIGVGKAPASFVNGLDVQGIVGSVNGFTLNTNSLNSGNIRKNTIVGTGGVTANDVVVLNASAQVVDTTTARDTRVYGIAAATGSSGQTVGVVIAGNVQAKCTGTVAIGDQLVTSTTSGAVATDNNATTGIVGTALSTCSGSLVSVAVHPINGQYAPRFRNASDSTSAFQIQNAAGTNNLFTADTSGSNINILGDLHIDQGGGNNGDIYMHNGDITNVNGFNLVVHTSDGLNLQTAAGTFGHFGYTNGEALFQNLIDSTNGFSIQNHAGTSNLFVADTTNTRIGIGTASPNTTLTVYNSNESLTQTDFTQALTKGGLNIVTDFTDQAYTPGLFWSTQNNNASKPKAGIYMFEDNTFGTSLLFGTSNSYTTGITNTALKLGPSGEALFKNGANSNAGFQVQDSSAAGLLTVNTNTGSVIASKLFIDTLGTGGTTALCLNGSSQVSSCASTGTIGFWNRTGTTLQPATAGDSIATTSGGTITSAGLLTGSAGLTVSGGATNINTTGANAVSIGGTSHTGGITIGNTAASETTLIQGGTGGSAIGVQAGASGTISIGTTNINTVTIGNTSNTGTLTFGQSTQGETINIGNGTVATGKTNTINIGTSATPTGKDVITIGNAAATASTVTIQGGNTSTAVSIQSAASGTINIATANAANTVQIGNTANAVSQTINIGNNNTASSNNTINIGSVVGTSPVTVKAGTSGITFTPAGGSANNGVLIKPVADTTAAFQVQKAGSAVNALNVDTTNMITTVRAGTDTAVLGSELFTGSTSFTSGSGWTSNGLTGQSASITHTSGTTAKSPTPALSISSGQDYVVTWDITNPNDGGNLTITMGGQTLATYAFDSNSAGSYTLSDSTVITTSSTANLSFTPNSAFTGTVSNISVKLISSRPNAALVINNTSGAPTLQVTASSDTTNMFVGWQAGMSNVGGSGAGNVALGPQALKFNIQGDNNTAIGVAALEGNVTGDNNVAVGHFALVSNTSGSDNIALGTNALSSNLRGGGNIALGSGALQSSIDGYDNIALGTNALSSATTAFYNLAIGSFNLQDVTTAGSNVALGYSSLRDTTSGSSNNGLGVFSLEHNTSGGDNVAFGTGALRNNTSGSQNIAIGNFAMDGNDSGFANTAIGTQALQGNDTGSYNTALGREAGVLFGGLQNTTVIGAEAEAGSSNTIILGYSEGRGLYNRVGIGTSFAQNPFEVAPNTYNTGTISQTGGSGTVVGSGTTFTSQMVGATIFYPDGTTGVITGFTNSTHITSNNTTGGWSAGTEYAIVWGGFNVNDDASVYLQNTSNTAQAFTVVNVAGNEIFNVNTSNSSVNITGSGSGLGGGRLTFGDYDPTTDLAVFIGEQGAGDTDTLQLNGETGIQLTSGSFTSPEIVGYFNYDSGRDSGVLALGESTSGGYLEFDNNGAFKWSIGMDSSDACGGTASDTLYFFSTTGLCSLQFTHGGQATFMAGDDTDALQVLNEDGDQVIDVDTTGTADTFHINQQDNGGGNLFHVQRQSDDAVIVDSGGHTTYRTLTGNDGANAFRLQNSASNTTYFTTDSTNYVVTVQGTTTTFGSLTVNNAHFKSTQTTKPGNNTPTNCGTSPSAATVTNSTDSAGSFTITTGTGSTSSTCDTQFNFNKAYGAAPKSIIVAPKTDAASAARQIYVSASATGSFTVKFGVSAGGANSTTYSYYYWIVE